MSSSPLLKRGTFSKLVTYTSSQKRIPSTKSLKTPPSNVSEVPQDQSENKEKIETLKSYLKSSKYETKAMKTKINYLKKKIKVLQEKIKQQSDSSIEISSAVKKVYDTQTESMKLINALFDTLDTLYTTSSSLNLPNKSAFKSDINQDLELNLIEKFQKFQNRTRISTRSYVKRIMIWRHKFTDDLIKPADSIKNSTLLPKKNSRSVSSIIASTIKVYAVGLKDHISYSPMSLIFRKGEIIEITNTVNGTCEGRIGDRQGKFPASYAKIV
jgi:hypothetical protein